MGDVANAFKAMKLSIPHPLDQLSAGEIEIARKAILEARASDVGLLFRSTYVQEPLKVELVKFLDVEHAGTVTSDTPRPPRLAMVHYDVIRGDKSHEYAESVVDIGSEKEISQRIVDKVHQPSLTS
jgi:primary-amine oxidase